MDHENSHSSSSQYNSTMISGTSHLNELQKENREPSPPINSLRTTNRSPLSNNNISSSSSPSVLSNTISTNENYRL